MPSRLLQKSIIFVETEDIELDDNEEEMDRVHRGDRRAQADDTADDTMQAEDREYLDSIIARFSQPQEQDAGGSPNKRKAEEMIQDSEKDIEAGASFAVAAADVTDDQGEEKKEKKSKKKTQIPFEQYRSITDMLGLFLKQQEDSGPLYQGTLWKDVVAWYLQLHKNELTDLEAFERQKKLVNQVIKRMIRHEGAIIEVDRPDVDPDTISNDDKLLRLNPSYEL
jgi:hypothetical protein